MEETNMAQVRGWVRLHFPRFFEEHGPGCFEEGNTFQAFERLADFLIEEGFAAKDDALVTKLMSHVAFLYEHGDDQVRNCLSVSFVEGLIDRGYRRGHASFRRATSMASRA